MHLITMHITMLFLKIKRHKGISAKTGRLTKNKRVSVFF